MARASRTNAVGGTAPEQRRSELQRYGDRALKVAEYTAAATTGVIVVATELHGPLTTVWHAHQGRTLSLQRYGDRALKVAEYTAAASVIVVATAGAFLGTIIVTKNPKAAAVAAGKVLNFTTKHYKTIAGSAAVVSGTFIREGADPAPST